MRIAIIGAGAMGSAIAATLTANGVPVLTPLDGRSEASRQRAAAAGMRAAAPAELAACDAILSIVPPAQAEAAAAAIFAAVAQARTHPLFAECNAIAPELARRLACAGDAAGCRFVDAGILGGPPTADGSRRPLFYASGPHADRFAALVAHRLDVQPLRAPVGAASALKMALAAVSKGMTGILALAILLAERDGVRDAFVDQLHRSQPGLAAWGRAQFPQLAGKAERWVDEMAALEAMLDDVPGGAAVFAGLADLFASLPAGISDAEVRRWAAELAPTPRSR